MRVHLGSDHAGYELKAHLAGWLAEHGHEVADHGPHRYVPDDDYPPYVMRAAAAAAAETGSAGILIGGSGNGEALAANKLRGVRAAVVWNDETAALARQHNDANVVSLGARMYSTEHATRLVEVFLTTPFSGEERHSRRLTLIAHYEESGELPSLPA